MRRRNKLVDRALAALVDASPADRVALIQHLTLTLQVPHRRSLPRRQVDRVFDLLSRGLRADPDATVREAIAYAFTFWFEQRAPRVLLPVLLNLHEPPSVRAQAAEGIGNVLEGQRLAPAMRASLVAALQQGLDDRSPEVRFWCLYAVGKLQIFELRPQVEQLRDTDQRVCPRWWRVSDEASDVLTCWDTGRWPSRDMVA